MPGLIVRFINMILLYVNLRLQVLPLLKIIMSNSACQNEIQRAGYVFVQGDIQGLVQIRVLLFAGKGRTYQITTVRQLVPEALDVDQRRFQVM